MMERRQFIRDARQRLATFTDLCALYGISRVTGYKWLARANASGLDFLQELSRRPECQAAASGAAGPSKAPNHAPWELAGAAN